MHNAARRNNRQPRDCPSGRVKSRESKLDDNPSKARRPSQENKDEAKITTRQERQEKGKARENWRAMQRNSVRTMIRQGSQASQATKLLLRSSLAQEEGREEKVIGGDQGCKATSGKERKEGSNAKQARRKACVADRKRTRPQTRNQVKGKGEFSPRYYLTVGSRFSVFRLC